MQYYETKELTPSQAEAFRLWFDKTIGTDREENECEDDKVYYLCSDLTNSEVRAIRQYENLFHK